MPVHQRRRARKVVNAQLWTGNILVEYFQTNLMQIFPNQPDMQWDHPFRWDQNEKTGYYIFKDIVVNGNFENEWDEFVDGWFMGDLGDIAESD